MRFDAAAHFLFVDDNEGQRRCIGRFIERVHPHVLTASSIAEARELIDDDRLWAGFIVDHRLPDPRGADFLLELRQRFPSAPLALMTCEASNQLAGRCVLARAVYLIAPVPPPVLGAFVRRAATSAAGLRWPTFTAFEKDAHLSERERVVAKLSLVDGMTKSEIATALGLSRDTVKTHVRNVLNKAYAESMETLRDQILELRRPLA